MGLDLVGATQAFTPAMTRTILATFKGKKKNEGRPTDVPGYAETLQLMRQLMVITGSNKVEDLQEITNGWIPHPSTSLVEDCYVPESFYSIAAKHIGDQLGPMLLNRIGPTWWQWRLPNSKVRAEWVEMKADYLERKASGDRGKKVMFYLHGGAYFFGGISHGAVIQRHARKLKGRVFAPRYRLAPSFPFPCAIQDCLSAYLYLLTIVEPSEIVLAGDSAGGGLCLALLLIIRDCRLPMPAGASLISPWVDLTHSFPSVTLKTELDYVPQFGFHAKPSMSWPPPHSDEMEQMGWPRHPGAHPEISIPFAGGQKLLKEQFQIYAQNTHLQIPLVSPITAPSLGGLCPLQILVGGGEALRDEIIYLAHKCANPTAYPPGAAVMELNGHDPKMVEEHPPTDVQLLMFDGAPHVACLLGHTPMGTYQFRSISQFTAWALGRAQKIGIEIEDDSSEHTVESPTAGFVGKAGDPIGTFQDHMIRLKVDMQGRLRPMQPASELRACNVPIENIAWPNETALNAWLAYRKNAEKTFAKSFAKVRAQQVKNLAIGFVKLPNGECAPPTALAGRRVLGQTIQPEKPRGEMGKSILGMLFGKFEQDNTPKPPRADVNANGTLVEKRKSKMIPYMGP